jgi:hypothetical protein
MRGQSARIVFALTLGLYAHWLGAAGADDAGKKLSPKETFPKVIDALVQGDVETLRRCTHASDEQARKVLQWLEDVAKAAAEARKAVIARFGEAGKTQLARHGNAFSKKDLADMIEEVDDKADTATVWLGDKEGNDPIAMRRIDGIWKLDIALMLQQDGWKPEKQAAESTAAVKRIKRFQQRVEGGEIKDAKEAAIWLRSAVLDADENQPDAQKEKEGL